MQKPYLDEWIPSERVLVCSVDDLARLFGVTTRYVQMLTERGVLKKTATSLGYRYMVSESIWRYSEYLKKVRLVVDAWESMNPEKQLRVLAFIQGMELQRELNASEHPDDKQPA